MFGRVLWVSHLVILVVVLARVVLALDAFWIILVAVLHCFALLVDYVDPSLDPRGPTPTSAARRLRPSSRHWMGS
jgi:hypothetical protein